MHCWTSCRTGQTAPPAGKRRTTSPSLPSTQRLPNEGLADPVASTGVQRRASSARPPLPAGKDKKSTKSTPLPREEGGPAPRDRVRGLLLAMSPKELGSSSQV